MTARDDILAIPDELLRTGKIAEAGLVFMDFASGARRWWTGTGNLVTAGHTWQGTGDVIEIGAVQAAYTPVAQPLTFQMAATAEMIDRVVNAEADVIGRKVTLFGHLFSLQPFTPIGAPYAHFAGTMEKLRFRQRGVDQARIELTCEGWLYRRVAPPRGRLTYADQMARHPGDKGLEYIGKYEDYETRWF